MAKEYTQEQMWKIYEKLPQNLRELIFSAKAADIIWNVCQRNKISGDNISKVAKNAGLILLGIHPLSKLQEIIQKELKIKEDISQKIFQEVNQLIFSQVKDDLNKLYGAEKKSMPASSEEKPKKPPGKDVYRETVE